MSVSDGRRCGVVSWDRARCSYRAEIDYFASPPGTGPQPSHPVDAWWNWLADPEPGVLPARVVIGHRPVEFLTVDSLVNRLATLGFHPDPVSLNSLFALRSEVYDRCGSVVFLGRPGPGAAGLPSGLAGEIVLGLPAGGTVPVRPLLEHPDHGFAWGHRAAATVRTAAAMVDLAWTPQRDAATEAAVVDLAISVLAEVRGGFVWRVESVADWIATETGELGEVGRLAGPSGSGGYQGFRQLSLEFR